MKNLVYGILFILLGGCVSPSFSPVEIHQRVAEQVKVLIDSGYLQTPYIEINEVLSNNSSIIYSIKGADSPGSDGAELPSKVMTYKGKYLCFIELDEQEMSRTELFEKGIVADSNFHENLHLDDGWVLALRKYENGSTLVKRYYHRLFFLNIRNFGRPFNQIIRIGGRNIQYTAFKLSDGTFNIGRIHEIL